ncbi:hypothetical protein LMG24238_03483 [Paraburkholderia sediminicola]|uniref:Uncharacterized protein n=1 Tax=Paraburkholderia sediminicola TaxID=458836 RepID=A0A6J5BB27_9BURK|nr:hypothetical protein LMG24238_03483 [Paraburkholderia sediminicola]
MRMEDSLISDPEPALQAGGCRRGPAEIGESQGSVSPLTRQVPYGAAIHTTVNERTPCAPRISTPSISAVAEGPVTSAA